MSQHQQGPSTPVHCRLLPLLTACSDLTHSSEVPQDLLHCESTDLHALVLHLTHAQSCLRHHSQRHTRLGCTGLPSGAGAGEASELPGAVPALLPDPPGRHSAAYSLRAREIMCAAITLLTPAHTRGCCVCLWT